MSMVWMCRGLLRGRNRQKRPQRPRSSRFSRTSLSSTDEKERQKDSSSSLITTVNNSETSHMTNSHDIYPEEGIAISKIPTEDTQSQPLPAAQTKEKKEIAPQKKLLSALVAFQTAAKDNQLKNMAYTQKATILKLLEEMKKSDDDEKTAEEAKKLVDEIKDSIVNTLTNLAVLSALVGITTYALVISPSSPSELDPPPSSVSINIPRVSTILNMACTASAMLSICLATSYVYILVNMLVDDEDIIWFFVNVHAVNQCLLFSVLAVLLAMTSLLNSCFALYSSTTARICVITGACLLGSFFFIIIPILRRVFNQIDTRVLRKKLGPKKQ